MPVRQRLPCLAMTAREDSIGKLILMRQMFPFLSPLNVFPRWPDSCLACPRSTRRHLEGVRPSGSRSSKIYLPDPWVSHRRQMSISIFYSCSVPSSFPLQHLCLLFSCWVFFCLLEFSFLFCDWNSVLKSHESLACCMPNPPSPIPYA